MGRADTLADHENDFLRDHRGFVGDVPGVPEHQLQGVLPGRQFEAGLGLPAPEMAVLGIVGKREPERGKVRVDEHVMMARIGLVDASRGHPHAPEAEA